MLPPAATGGAAAAPRGRGDAGMSDTRELLAKITALRQRLDQAQSLVSEASSAAALLSPPSPAPPPRPPSLEREVQAGSEHDLALDAAVRAHTSGGDSGESRTPRQLSGRA